MFKFLFQVCAGIKELYRFVWRNRSYYDHCQITRPAMVCVYIEEVGSREDVDDDILINPCIQISAKGQSVGARKV
jgi:hypothetical protein